MVSSLILTKNLTCHEITKKGTSKHYNNHWAYILQQNNYQRKLSVNMDNIRITFL